ncbi:MAG: D-alanyl-D-alanine carboxypeptidase/D-alanyl-D-alanine-endopeptidase, partial [Micromonosporaceae bacterium]|nr:D-alanyl-D-alanine carboxypeptidase/D-alanyl-D-alanine-endopeptidase [Micromonosporaceae bacterium]
MRGRLRILISATVLALAATSAVAVAESYAAAPASVADLSRDIDEILSDSRMVGSQAGVLVRDADTDEVLYAKNTDARL